MADNKPIEQVVSATDTIEPVKDIHAVIGKGGDKANVFLAEHGEVAFDYEEERQVLRRIDRRILPLILGAYFFQQLDKSALSYTSIFGLNEDANLKGTEYSWLGKFDVLRAFVTGRKVGLPVNLKKDV